MIPEYVISFMKIAHKHNCKAFINEYNEMIVEPKHNIYFRLDNVKCEMDMKKKVVSWLSRHGYKGLSETWKKRIRDLFNEYLGKNFTKEEMGIIYGELGMKYDYTEVIKFIESGYDLETLKNEIKD